MNAKRASSHSRRASAGSTGGPLPIFSVFRETCDAITRGVLISRPSQRDKEFAFQDWFSARLTDCGLLFDQNGRNSYPDFFLVNEPLGFETKGLGWPGREANYDCNSQAPSGLHNGRTIYYVFGRYPARQTGSSYPVIDLVICHGDFLNADHSYVHENKNLKTFGSYGDIMLRDRKMYVAPTPFALTEGTTGQRTLIVPSDTPPPSALVAVGSLVRVEAERLLVGYSFDLTTNTLTGRYVPNPAAGKSHAFMAYRLPAASPVPVSMKQGDIELDEEDDDDET
jgi:hypothetical protein